MSLYRQLWLAVIATTLVAFSGSFILGMLSTRGYLEEQLGIKNADNAAALALSISQQPNKDRVTQELLVAAQFDSGHYQTIRFADPYGKTLVERSGATSADDVPQWFARLFPIESTPGTAQITSGWQQIGTITVVSHASFAYRELWRNSIQMFAWFALAGIVTGLIATAVLRRLQRPLANVVAQAHAIGERRFVTIPSPGVPELDSLAGAMNSMVTRLKSMFDEQASRIEDLRRRANHDPLTGLANRAYFQNRLQAMLDSDESAERACLLLIRVPDLLELNRRLGRKAVDELLGSIANCIEQTAKAHDESFAARLNGADFALLLPGVADGRPAAENTLAGLRALAPSDAGIETIAQIGIGHFNRGMSVGAVLARADRALAAAESSGGSNWQTARDEDSAFQPANSADWVRQIRDVIAAGRIRLAGYPVCANDGRLLHEELMLRVQIDEAGDWIAAGQIVPMASRVGLTGELDLAVVDLAIARIREGAGVIAVNLAAESAESDDFRRELLRRLRSIGPASRLALEVSEHGLLRHFTAVRSLREAMVGSGVGFGVEHVGRRFGEIARLHELGLDYIKVDASFIRGVDANGDNRAFLEGLASIAHGMGARVIAEGVQSSAELAALPALGFDGATGPAVTSPTP